MKDELKTNSIKKWQLLSIASFFIVLILAGSYYYYKHEENSIRLEKHEDLRAISNLKIQELTQWLKERNGDAATIVQSPFFTEAVRQLIKNENNESLRKQFIERFQPVKNNYGYENILIGDISGNLLFSFEKEAHGIDSLTNKNILDLTVNGNIQPSDFYFCEPHGEIHFDIIAPIKENNSNPIAVLILRIKPDDYLYPLIQIWPTKSKTAETLIIREEGDSVLFLNELRHHPDAKLKLRLPKTKKDVPAVQAVLGHKGIFEGKDYRGVDVLSDIRNVPGTNWFMIAKIDKSEIFSDLKFRAAVILFISFLMLLTLGFILAWIYNSKQKDIYKELFLIEKALRQTEEEYKITLYSIGDAVITTDAKGLVQNLNPVAEQLTGWTESDAKNKKLDIVFKIINEDTRSEVESPVHKVLREGLVVGLANHTLLISREGNEIPIADSGAPIKTNNGEIVGVVLVFRDQTEERNAQKEIKNLNRVYALLSNTNQAIVRIKQQKELFDEICRIAIDDGKFKIAWLGMLNKETNLIDVVAAAQLNTEINCEDTVIESEINQCQCLSEKVLTTQNSFISNDLKNDESILSCKNESILIGCKSAASFPIKVFGHVVGTLNLFAKELDFFHDAEIKLLEEMSMDISFAIEFLETEKHRTEIEENLKKKEGLLSFAGKMAKFGAWSFDIKNNVLTWSDEVAEIHEVSHGFVPNVEDGINFYAPESRQKITQVFTECLTKGVPYDEELQIITANGNRVWVRTIGKAIKNEDGEIIRVDGAFQDISAQKKTEDVILKEKEWSERIINSAPNIIIGLGTNSEIMIFNRFVQELTGYSSNEVVGKRWIELFIPENFKESIYKVWDGIISKKLIAHSFENEIVTKCGEKRLIKWSNSLLTENDQFKMVLSIGEDVTEQRKAEESLKKIEWMLSKKEGDREYADSIPGYGELTELNKCRLILESVGKDLLADIANDYLSLLGTSSAVYEKNGDYALGIFSSGWCKFLDSASRNLCTTDDNLEALSCGKWLCHESCWKDASLAAIESGAPVDVECNGGLHLYAIPIAVGEEIIGAINFGYGDPPSDKSTLMEIANKYKVSVEELEIRGREYETRPPYIIEMAKNRLSASAKLIGEIVGRKLSAEKLFKSEEHHRVLINTMNDGLMQVDNNDVIIFVNQTLCDIFGYQKSEMIGKIGNELLIYEEDRAIVKERNESRLQNIAGKYEVRGIKKSGEIIWLSISGAPLKDESGKIIGSVGILRDITQRKEFEEKLKESEAFTRTVMDNLPVGIAVNTVSPTVEFTYINDNFIKHYRTTREALSHPDDFWNVVYEDPAFREEIKKRVLEDCASGDPSKMIWRDIPITRKGEKTTYVSARNIPIQGRNIMISTVIDVTDRKQREIELHQSEERIRLIVQTTSAVLYMLRYSDMKYEYVDPVIEKLTGYSSAEINEMGFDTLVEKIETAGGDEVESKNLEINRQKLEYEFHADYLIKKKNGGYCWLSDHSYPWYNEKNELMGSIGILNDITYRKEIENEINEEKNKFEQLFENSPVAIALLNSANEVLSINNSFFNLFGHSIFEIEGKNIDGIIVPEEHLKEASDISEITHLGKSITKEGFRIKKDGSKVFVQLAGIPVIADGKIIAIYAMYVDLTDRKKAEEEIRIAKEKAEEMARVKSYFFANMSHELRTPLIGILGFSEIMQDYVEDNVELLQMAKTIHSSGFRLLETLNNILRISKIEAEKVEYILKVTNIIPLVNDCVNLYSHAAKSFNVELTTSYKSDKINCSIDTTLFREVMNNLVNNAIKFSQDGSVIVKVEKNKSLAVVKVIDTGIGIPEDKKDLIWEAFRQVSEGISRGFEGTGLGLTISKKYIELMNGVIYFESKEGKGTTFTIELPLSKEEEI